MKNTSFLPILTTLLISLSSVIEAQTEIPEWQQSLEEEITGAQDQDLSGNIKDELRQWKQLEAEKKSFEYNQAKQEEIARQQKIEQTKQEEIARQQKIEQTKQERLAAQEAEKQREFLAKQEEKRLQLERERLSAQRMQDFARNMQESTKQTLEIIRHRECIETGRCTNQGTSIYVSP